MRVRRFKGSETGIAFQLAMHFPLNETGDELGGLMAKILPEKPGDWLFPANTRFPRPPADHRSISDHNKFVQQLVQRWSLEPPKGTKFSGRSLRSGGLTAAYSVGVRTKALQRLSGHQDEQTLYKYYVDATKPPTREAHLFFDRLLHQEAASCSRDTMANN